MGFVTPGRAAAIKNSPPIHVMQLAAAASIFAARAGAEIGRPRAAKASLRRQVDFKCYAGDDAALIAPILSVQKFASKVLKL